MTTIAQAALIAYAKDKPAANDCDQEIPIDLNSTGPWPALSVAGYEKPRGWFENAVRRGCTDDWGY